MRTIVIIMVIAFIAGASRMAFMIKWADHESKTPLVIEAPKPPEPRPWEKKLIQVKEEIRQTFGHDYTDETYAKAGTLPKGHQVIFLTMAFEDDVMRGGFDSYFWRHGDKHAQKTFEAVKAIGAAGCLGPFKQAIRVFREKQNCFEAARGNPNPEIGFRQWAYDSKLDQYNALLGAAKDDIDTLRAEYVWSHPDLFP